MSVLAVAVVLSAAAPIGGAIELPPFPPTASITRGRQVELIPQRPAVEAAGWLITRRPPVSGAGRVWRGGTILGSDIRGTDPGRDPSAARLGAAGESARVPVRVGQTVVSLDPFVPLGSAGLRSLERARQSWLTRRGYTGGVRTFVNPRIGSPDPAGDHPVAVIRAPVRTRTPGEELHASSG